VKARPLATRASTAPPPPALLAHTDPLWRDHRRVAQWWEKYLGRPAPSETDTFNAVTWATRFDRAAVAWAQQTGLVTGDGYVDWSQLEPIGILRPLSVERAAARAGSDYCVHT
jgi:hypothetical protein